MEEYGWTIRQSEPGLFTVGYVGDDGFKPQSDHEDMDMAARTLFHLRAQYGLYVYHMTERWTLWTVFMQSGGVLTPVADFDSEADAANYTHIRNGGDGKTLIEMDNMGHIHGFKEVQ